MLEVISRLTGSNVTVDDPIVLRRHADIVHAIALENKGGSFKAKEIFEMGKTQNLPLIQ
jgi:hypothetical protein